MYKQTVKKYKAYLIKKLCSYRTIILLSFGSFHTLKQPKTSFKAYKVLFYAFIRHIPTRHAKPSNFLKNVFIDKKTSPFSNLFYINA